MHKLAEKIADCMKAKVEGMGIDNIEGQNLVEFELWSKIIKNLVCYDKDKKIIEAMDEAEDSKEAMKYIEMYENYPEDDRKGYIGQPRNSKGQYMSSGGRRGYEEPMYYTMTPHMYKEHSPEYYRDLDRDSLNRMYYSSGNMGGQSSSGMSDGSMGSQGGQSSGGSSGGSRGYSDSRYENAKRGYQETKEMHKSGSTEDKQITMKEGEKMVNVILDEIEEMLQDAPAEMKSMVKSKVMTKMQKI